jgi:hypothetical protein
MSKRKNRATPNITPETLERAPQQAAAAPAAPATADATTDSAPPPVVKPTTSSRAAALNARRGSMNAASTADRRRKGTLSTAEVVDILEHPTKEVSEDEMRAQYSYVLADLRSMGILAAALLLMLVVLAQVMPHLV